MSQIVVEETKAELVLPSGKLASVTRKINDLRLLLSVEPPVNYNLVIEHYSLFGQRLETLDTACKEEFKKTLTEEDHSKLISWQTKYEPEIDSFRKEVQIWLVEHGPKSLQNPEEVKLPTSEGSVSARSDRSETSVVLRARLADQRAKRDAEEKYNIELKHLQQQMEDLKTKKDIYYENNLEKEIKAIEAQETKVSNNIYDNNQFDNFLAQQTKLVEIMSKNCQKSNLPCNEPPIFDGEDITLFKPFIRSFHMNITSRCDNDSDKLQYLEKYTVGAPRDLVRSCFGRYDGYQAALKLLEDRYDNEFKIAECYLNKIEKFPDIKTEDCKAFERYSIFLTSCFNVMNDIDALNQLNSPKDIMLMVKKLPYKYREKWRLYAYELNKRNVKINFQHLVHFVNEQSSIVNFPIFNNLKDDKEHSLNVPQNNRQKNVFVTNAQTDNFAPRNDVKIVCICCKKNNHTVDTCIFFGKMSHDDKLKMVRENQLCFSCLKPGHRSSGCFKRSTCSKCQRRHPTILHNDNYKSPRDTEVRTFSLLNKNADNAPKIAHSVIPVKIRAKSCSDYMITYMAMDNFSSDCFINEKLMNKLGLSGNKTDIYLTTFEGTGVKRPTYAINNLEITDLDENEYALLPTIYSCTNWPFDKSDCPQENDVINLPYLNDIPFRYVDSEIGILVGANMPSILKPLKVVERDENEPYAVLHKFGWSLNGPLKSKSSKISKHCHRIKISNIEIDEKINKLFNQDFVDGQQDELGLSMDDRKWLNIMENTCTLKNGNFEIKLPLKENCDFPDNRLQVLNRLQSGRKKLLNNTGFHEEYTAFMNEMLTNGFAEKVPEEEINKDKGKVWYLVHHGVYHPTKGKIRIVFDCSLKYNNVSLNDELLQGIDLTNNLLNVLIRFRQHRIGIMGDIAKMFYQVHIPVEDRDYLRYFWYPNGDLNKTPVEYRLTVHVFGAKSSPSCANFALKNTVHINPKFFSFEAQKSVEEDFYVDDWVKSVDSACEGKKLMKEVGEIVSQAGFNLTSFSSNSRELLTDVAHDKLAKEFRKVNLLNDSLPHEKALGVNWCPDNDYLGFDLNFKENKCTKRGILSTTFSIYDPFGFLSPVILVAKRIFQIACNMNLDWDDELPSDLKNKWNIWFNSAKNLSNFKVPRCYSYFSSNTIKSIQLHIFCDGSETAYAASVYIRIESTQGTQCSLLLSKSRLTPISNSVLKTIPRIELAAAHLAIKVKNLVMNALTLYINDCFYWTDSLTVLKYISNDSTRFQRFVSNKVAFIRSHSEPSQWHYVPSEINIADVASRGMNVDKFLSCTQWTCGPDFLLKDQNQWPVCPKDNLNDCDLEIKTSNFCVNKNCIEDDLIYKLLTSCSSWFKIKTRVAWILKVKDCLKNKCKVTGKLSVLDLELAERAIFAYVQRCYFNSEITALHKNENLLKNSPLLKLHPFVDNDGLIRVGGRIIRSNESFEFKHPIVLPNKCFVTELLIRHLHVKVGHLGKKSILSALRQNYWVIGASGMIDKVTRNCISCRKQHSKPSVQIMANLPVERFKCNLKPFSYIGIDCFGPFNVTRGRKTEKRYGIIFTCLSSRAIHLEVLSSLDTESFLCAFSRFTSRRGPVITIRSDNGGNFVAGNKLLNNCINEWNKHSHSWMLQRNIQWIFQPPLSSHFGGIWEAEIRSVRKVLNAMLSEQNIRLTDERLNTLMCEVESVLNSRPLTELSNDVYDLEPLTPNHILLCYSTVSFPPGLFNENDLYVRNRWRQVQYLANLFWSRWRKEYLPLLQKRQKWLVNVEPHKIGDLVLITDQILPRNQWSTGRIVEVAKDKFGNVRSAKVRVAKAYKLKNKIECATKILERPIVKLILLRSNETA